MFTEKSLRDNAHLVKALMGVTAEDFYPMLEQIEQRLPCMSSTGSSGRHASERWAGGAILDCH